MSITITTDVFCDICPNWFFGVTGPRADVRSARSCAKQAGWTRRLRNGRMVDLCPHCSAKDEGSMEPDWQPLPTYPLRKEGSNEMDLS